MVKASSLISELPSSGKGAVMLSPRGEGAAYGLRWGPVARRLFGLFDGSASSYIMLHGRRTFVIVYGPRYPSFNLPRLVFCR